MIVVVSRALCASVFVVFGVHAIACSSVDTAAKEAACLNGVCADGSAQGSSANDGANDGKMDDGETDVDCGGPNAPPCAEGKSCVLDTDCADKWCNPSAKTCAAPRNDDGVKNGTETDVDCGGQSGKRCAEGLACVADSDCTGACSYAHKCVDAPSCKPHLGGDTCGVKALHPGELGDADPAATQESCCRSLNVPGYADPMNPGKTVLVDKYEITAGRVRAFIESLAAANNGQPDIKSWIAAHRPPIWDDNWNTFLPSGTDQAETPSGNVGTDNAFGSPLYTYVHGHNCGNLPGSYGFPTYWYPDDLLTSRGEVPRAQGFDGNGASIPAKDVLDVKTMTCIPNAVLAAFCHWDGGQLATDEVLDFITDAPATLRNQAGCGKRCAPLNAVQATADSGNDAGILYRFPLYADDATHEGTYRIATPGRVHTDVVRFNPGDEPWMDLHGNVQEVVLDTDGATFTGSFGLKYRGIGYSSARAVQNPTKIPLPEYKAAYSGGRCMRFK